MGFRTKEEEVRAHPRHPVLVGASRSSRRHSLPSILLLPIVAVPCKSMLLLLLLLVAVLVLEVVELGFAFSASSSCLGPVVLRLLLRVPSGPLGC